MLKFIHICLVNSYFGRWIGYVLQEIQFLPCINFLLLHYKLLQTLQFKTTRFIMSESSGSEVWHELHWAEIEVLAGLLSFPETGGKSTFKLIQVVGCIPFFGVVGLWLLALSQGLVFAPKSGLSLPMLTVSSWRYVQCLHVDLCVLEPAVAPLSCYESLWFPLWHISFVHHYSSGPRQFSKGSYGLIEPTEIIQGNLF